MSSQSEPECCPKFDPISWDDKVVVWRDKKFVSASVCTLFYMPMNFGCVMRRLDKKIREAGATMADMVCLSDHTSKWNMDLYLAVDKEIPGLKNIILNGRFYSKVFEGPFQKTGIWAADFKELAKAKGYSIKKWYMWYTTCPKCAKKYGKNYVVIVAQID